MCFVKQSTADGLGISRVGVKIQAVKGKRDSIRTAHFCQSVNRGLESIDGYAPFLGIMLPRKLFDAFGNDTGRNQEWASVLLVSRLKSCSIARELTNS